jgi:hypothetical protein
VTLQAQGGVCVRKEKGFQFAWNFHDMMVSPRKFYMKDGLTEEEKSQIQERFHEEIVPKLKKLDARLGTISCEFAGPLYAHWMIQFRSRGDDFDIVDFEFDETGTGMDLDL